MFKFLFVMFFFFILLVFLMGFSILRTFKNILFGNGNSKKCEQRRQTSGYSSNTRSNSSARDEYASQSSRKKIFAKDEGEYVDYEEVK
ncbi:MAG: DUF4834 family protein [Parabacteroides sp.]|nr:DUF4834 family protein [Parabacteroides sp.]